MLNKNYSTGINEHGREIGIDFSLKTHNKNRPGELYVSISIDRCSEWPLSTI